MIDFQFVPSNLNPKAHHCTISIVSKTCFSLVRWAPEENYPQRMEDATSSKKIDISRNGTYLVEIVTKNEKYIMPLTVCHFAQGKRFAGGIGTKEDPYLIENCTQFNCIRMDLKAHYRLIADLDFEKEMENLCWIPIGRFTVKEPKIFDDIPLEDQNLGYQFDYGFQGTLDGNGHTVSGLCCRHPSKKELGIFGSCGPDAHIFDLRINRCICMDQGDAVCVGSITGRAEGTKIERCTVLNTQVYASTVGGGVIGEANIGTYISSCCFQGKISGTGIYGPYSHLGGIAGSINGVGVSPKVLIKDCFVQATIDNCMWGGGITTGLDGLIKKCRFDGVVCARAYAGAIAVPTGSCIIEECEEGRFETAEKVPKISGEDGGTVSVW